MLLISLSILEYEPELSKHINDLSESLAFLQILQLVGTKRIHCLHIDVMRPPLIPDRTAFSIELIKELYHALSQRIPLAIHLMVPDPILIIDKIGKFISRRERTNTSIILQRESFDSEIETLKAIDLVREKGYSKVGICLDLPTPCEALSEKIIEAVNMILLMTVRMGRGGQKYADKGTEKISYFSQRYPNMLIEVDGGINPQTAQKAKNAGAKAVVVGSYITRSNNPTEALLELTQTLMNRGKHKRLSRLDTPTREKQKSKNFICEVDNVLKKRARNRWD